MGEIYVKIDGKWKRWWGTLEEAREYVKKLNESAGIKRWE